METDMNEMRYRVTERNSVRYDDAATKSLRVLLAGEEVPPEVGEQQIEAWLAGGFIERLDDPDTYDDERERQKGVGTKELRRRAQARLAEVARVRERELMARMVRDLVAPVPVPVPVPALTPAAEDVKIQHAGVWDRDPEVLRGLDLEKLQVQVAEVASEHGLDDIEIPESAEACVALLSSQYVPGIVRV
jgi:hypothetical protein